MPDTTESTSAGAAASGLDVDDLVLAYAELQQLLLDSDDVTGFLDQVAILAATLLDCSAGVMLRRDHQLTTVSSSDNLARQVDEIQYGRGRGPCLQALNTNDEVVCGDLATDDRWGDYREHAIAHGVASSLSLPLTVDAQAVGSLNLYSRRPGAFDTERIQVARAFARQAGTALALVLRRTDQVRLERQLRDALVTRAAIDQACGILMGSRRITAVDAFAVLRAASHAQNRPMSHVAADIITTFTGHPPTVPRPFADPR